jgi:carbonic anhydrase/acetyltransferase-like protein (isoleucine patch superfamily)
MIHENVSTDFSPAVHFPKIADTAYIHPRAVVIGNVQIGKRVIVCPFAAVRGDEGQPLYIGDETNIQDGVVIHALETESGGRPVAKNRVTVNGESYAVYVGNRVSLAHQSQIHGPAQVGDDTFIGMQTLVFRAAVGTGCVVEPGCILMGVDIPGGRYVPAGTVLKTQTAAGALPKITDDYPLKDINRGVVHVNTRLADGYNHSAPLK